MFSILIDEDAQSENDISMKHSKKKKNFIHIHIQNSKLNSFFKIDPHLNEINVSDQCNNFLNLLSILF